MILCGAVHEPTGYQCTLDHKHDGDHRATLGPIEMGGPTLAVWPRSNLTTNECDEEWRQWVRLVMCTNLLSSEMDGMTNTQLKDRAAKDLDAWANERHEDGRALGEHEHMKLRVQNEMLTELVADLCNQFAYDGSKDGGPALTTGGLSVLEDSFKALGWEDPHPIPAQRCDEPGCGERSTCGTPTPTGYRRTCVEHFPK